MTFLICAPNSPSWAIKWGKQTIKSHDDRANALKKMGTYAPVPSFGYLATAFPEASFRVAVSPLLFQMGVLRLL
jgi:hypothetical protein